MRFRFTLKRLLVGVAVVAILITSLLLMARRYDVESRRIRTLEGLKSMNVSRGGDEIRQTQDILINAVEEATYSSLRTPRILAARLVPEHPNVGDGYFISINWVCHSPVAEGIEVTFSNGTTESAKFSDSTLAENNANGKVLFYGVISRNELPPLAKELAPNDIRSIVLVTGNDVCSDSFSLQQD